MSIQTFTTRAPKRAHDRRRRHSAGYVGGYESRQILAGVLTFISELMITTGILLALLVVWELFWTDIDSGREQSQIVEDLSWDASVLPIPDGSDAPSPSADGGPVYEIIPASDRHTPDELAPPVIAEPAHAETFATMYVPKWGFDYVKPISQGVSRADVLDRKGIGHYPGTAMPGGEGNFAVAAHRTTHARPFWDIAKLDVGHAIVIRTEDTWYVYKVTDYFITDPSDVDTIAPVPGVRGSTPDGYFITLTSCHPKYSARQRYIVHGELLYWAPADSGGVPPELVPDGATTEEAA